MFESNTKGIAQARCRFKIKEELEILGNNYVHKMAGQIRKSNGDEAILFAISTDDILRILNRHNEAMELDEAIGIVNSILSEGLQRLFQSMRNHEERKSEEKDEQSKAPSDLIARAMQENVVVREGDSRKQIRPEHYGGPANMFEPIKVITAWGLNFNLGNVVKYVARAGKKSETPTKTDLRKALTYLQFELDRLDAEEKAAQQNTSCDIPSVSEVMGRKVN